MDENPYKSPRRAADPQPPPPPKTRRFVRRYWKLLLALALCNIAFMLLFEDFFSGYSEHPVRTALAVVALAIHLFSAALFIWIGTRGNGPR
jgi:hypothetical protein